MGRDDAPPPRALRRPRAERPPRRSARRWREHAANGRDDLRRGSGRGPTPGDATRSAGRTRRAGKPRPTEAFALNADQAFGTADEPSYAARVRSTAAAWQRAEGGAPHVVRLGARPRRRQGRAGSRRCSRGSSEGTIDAAALETAFAHSFYTWWVDALFESEPRLRRFRGAEQNARVETFGHWTGRSWTPRGRWSGPASARRFPPGAPRRRLARDSSEMGILHRELLKRRNMPIRRLFERIPNVLAPPEAVHADEPALGGAVPRAGLPRVRSRRVRRGLADPAVGRRGRDRARRRSWWSWATRSSSPPPPSSSARTIPTRPPTRTTSRRWRASSTSASPRASRACTSAGTTAAATRA